MDLYKEIKKDCLESIERRFQFIIFLVLFVPFVIPNVNKIYPTIGIGLSGETLNFFGIVAEYLFLSYFGFESFRRNLSINTLYYISQILVVLSYCLITLIAFSLIEDKILTGWKSLLFGFCALGIFFLPVILVGVMSIPLLIDCYRWIRGKIK